MGLPLPPNPYHALGVDHSADAAVIKAAYRKLALKCHPDKFPDPTLKAQKQEEFQRVQQAYEILGDEARRREYDLEVKAKRLREELLKSAATSKTTSPLSSRYVNVDIRTAEPPRERSAWKHSSSKSSPYKSNPREFTKSWEHEIPTRSKVFHDEERRTRRAASYEKPAREESRERRTRADGRDREKRRLDDEWLKEFKRQQAREREERELRELRERSERRSERKVREEARPRAEPKTEKKTRGRWGESERDARRRKEDDKSRSKSKPYVEHSGYSEEDNDVRRSQARTSSSPRKPSDSPTRAKSFTKQRERSSHREDGSGDKYRSTLAYAASYLHRTSITGSNTTPPRHSAEVPAFSPAYPDPSEKWTPPKSQRRASGDVKHVKDDPIIVDVPGTRTAHPGIPTASPPTQPAPPRLQKSHTMPSGYSSQPYSEAAMPKRTPLSRSFTMQPEYDSLSRSATDRYKSAKRTTSFDDGGYLGDPYAPPVSKVHYTIGSRGNGTPRVIDTKYPGSSFTKIKTAPSYSAEHVATSRRFDAEDVAVSEYSNMRPSYADYGRTAAVG